MKQIRIGINKDTLPTVGDTLQIQDTVLEVAEINEDFIVLSVENPELLNNKNTMKFKVGDKVRKKSFAKHSVDGVNEFIIVSTDQYLGDDLYYLKNSAGVTHPGAYHYSHLELIEEEPECEYEYKFDFHDHKVFVAKEPELQTGDKALFWNDEDDTGKNEGEFITIHNDRYIGYMGDFYVDYDNCEPLPPSKEEALEALKHIGRFYTDKNTQVRDESGFDKIKAYIESK